MLILAGLLVVLGSVLAGYATAVLSPNTPYSVVDTFASSGPCSSIVVGSFTTR